MIIEAGLPHAVGDVLVLSLVLGMAAIGYQHGVFLALLAGFGALATLLISLGLGEWVATLLLLAEFPAAYAFPVAACLLAVISAIIVRKAIGVAIPEGTLRFSPLMDQVGGVCVGALAGTIVAGGVLVLLSILPLPESYRIDGSKTRYDLGSQTLRMFARLIEPRTEARKVLLEGEPPGAADPEDGPACSELFVDVNGNGLYDRTDEAAERYLDHDVSGGFTPRASFSDGNKNGVRDIGLLERYRLGAWNKLRVMHHPTITSKGTVEIPSFLKDGQQIYTVTASDLDAGDVITFSIREPETRLASVTPAGDVSSNAAPSAVESDATEPENAPFTDRDDVAQENPEPLKRGDPENRVDPFDESPADVKEQPQRKPLFVIDATTGVVSAADALAFMQQTEPARIIVVATDKQGLSTEKTVTIKYRGPKPRD